ncbi:ATP synthase F1 subunit gamma [bacterium]|nr:ATP synthase F1 subunit gamma [bacterium]
MSLKSVKNKIRSVGKTAKVTKAMEAVSAVKMRKSQLRALESRPYAVSALTILRNASGSLEAGRHPLTTARNVKKTGIVVVTSDKGLAGSLNSAVLKNVHAMIGKNGLTPENIGFFCIGRKGADHFASRGFNVVERYERWGDFVDFDGVHPIVERVRNLFLEGEFDEFQIVYTSFISTLKQEVRSERLLPITFEGVARAVDGILPETGRYADRAAHGPEPVKEYTFEPSADAVLNEIIPMLLAVHVYHAILEANASEHSARMIAMKNASDNAEDLSESLSLSYNKARQAAITREVSEIVGGMEALK